MMNPAIERVIGRLLRPLRGRDGRLAWNDSRLAAVPATIRLSSPDFADGGALARRHAGEGENRSPALAWSNLPAGTAELVLILEDPDAPLPRPAIHLVAHGISPQRDGVPEGALNAEGDGAISFARGFLGRRGYGGPGPPRGHGAHRYVFEILALSAPLSLPAKAGLAAVLDAATGKILARGKLVGTYERS